MKHKVKDIRKRREEGGGWYDPILFSRTISLGFQGF
jgi:hypothetical protein